MTRCLEHPLSTASAPSAAIIAGRANIRNVSKADIAGPDRHARARRANRQPRHRSWKAPLPALNAGGGRRKRCPLTPAISSTTVSTVGLYCGHLPEIAAHFAPTPTFHVHPFKRPGTAAALKDAARQADGRNGSKADIGFAGALLACARDRAQSLRHFTSGGLATCRHRSFAESWLM